MTSVADWQTRRYEAHQRVTAIAEIMAFALDESPDRALQLAREWHAISELAQRQWHSAGELTLREALCEAEVYARPDMLRLVDFLQRNAVGVVLATIHMGDYLRALFAVLSRVPERHILIVRRRQASSLEQEVFAKLSAQGLCVEVVRSTQAGAALRIHRGLRRGGLVVTFYDLPYTFGPVLPLQFFRHQVYWVKGPVVAAVQARALLVPFVTYWDGQPRCDLQPTVLFGEQPTDKALQIQRAMQQLVEIASQYIRRAPEQWLHWHLLPQMLENPSAGPNAQVVNE
ncbi:MAG: hypothetical protein AAF993_16510 [Pseudomonadota bacterium]